jgi:gliding motility-associated-like protein
MSQVTFQAVEQGGCAPLGVVINVTAPTSGITSYAWTITTPSGSILTASSPQYVSIFNTPGSYDVSLTINGSQTQTIQDYIQVHSKPTAAFVVADNTGCFPHCTDFTSTSTEGSGAIISWNWDFGDGTTSTSETPNHCYSGAGIYSPVLSVADENGCFANITMPSLVTVTNNFPNANIALSPEITCSVPAMIAMTNSSTGGLPLSSSWDFGDGTGGTTAGTASVNHTYSNPGVYQVCLTVEDTESCSNQECTTLTILDDPNPQFTVSDTEACAGQTIQFTSTTNPIPVSVEWDFDNNGTTDSTNPEASYSYAVAGTYHPKLTVIYSPSCSAIIENSIEIIVSPGLIVSFASAQTQSCIAPFQATLFSSVSGPGPYVYSWSVNGTGVGSSSNLAYSFPSAGSYDVSLMVTNPGGCSSTSTINDYISISTPSISFNHPETACYEELVAPTSISITGGSSISSYSWDFDGDGIEDSDESNPSFAYNAQGSYFISVSIVTAQGCTASTTSSFPVLVQAPLSTSFTSNYTTTCSANAIEFCIPAVNGNTYSWNFNDGTGWIILNPTETCIEHMYEDTGYFDLSIAVINGTCNIADTLENYIYIEPPVALFDYSVNCVDNTTVSVGDQSIGANSIDWDFGDGTVITSGASILTHTYATSGTYEITLTAHGSDPGCDDLKIHTINLAVPDASVSFSQSTGCAPLSVTLAELNSNIHWDVQVSNGDELTADWDGELNQWSVEYTNEGITYQYNSPSNINFWPQFIFTEQGCYDFTVNAVNEFNCPSSAYYEDAVCVSAGADFASFQINVIEQCDSVLIQFTPDATNISTAEWSFGDGTISTEISPQHEFNAPYDYINGLNVTLNAVNVEGCVSSVTQNLLVDLPTVPSFNVVGSPGCRGEDIQFNSTTNGPVANYNWTFGDANSGNLNTSTEINPTHAYADNGTYEVCLTVESTTGCIRTYCNPTAVVIANPEVSFTYTSSINNCLFGVQMQNTTPGTNTNFFWNFGDGQSGSGASTYHTYPIGVYEITLNVTAENGCTDSLTIPDILNYGNQVGSYSITLDDANCAPFTTQLQAFNPADTYFTYFWDFNDGYGDPSGNTIVNHDYLSAGTYCPQLIMTDPNGCQVFIPCENPIVVDEFVMNYTIPTAICYGDTISVLVTNADSYSWSGSAELAAGAGLGEYTLFPSDDTDFILTGTYADCERTDIIHVDVNQLPNVSLSMLNSVCHHDSIFNLSGGMPAGVTGEYFIDGIMSTQFDPSWNPEASYLVEYVYTDSLGCVNTANESVYIHELPLVTLASFTEVCEDASIVPMAGGEPLFGVYTMNEIPVIDFDPSTGVGQYEVEYTYTDNFGCISSDSKLLVVHDLPNINLTFQETCANVLFEISNTSFVADGAITETEWTFGDAAAQSVFTPIPFFFDNFGQRSIHVEMTSEFGCFAQLDTSTYIYAVPQAMFQLEDGCQGTDLTFTSSSTTIEDEIVQWVWEFESMVFNDNDTINYAYGQWGSMPAELVVITNQGCSDTLQQYVSVYPAPEVAITTNDICLGEVAQFVPVIDLPYGGIESYLWNLGIVWDEPVTPIAEHLYDSTGTYIISLEVMSNLGCSTIAEVELNVNANASVDFAIESTHYCEGDIMGLFDLSSVESPNTITSWEWYLDEALISTDQNPAVAYFEAGTYDLKLVTTTNNGCTSDSTLQHYLSIYPKPEAGFTLDRDEVVMYGATVEVTNTASGDITNWSYDFGDGTVESFQDGQHMYDTWDNYSITQIVMNTFGCSDTLIREVLVSPSLVINIPNAFTPEGNGHNDVFRPVLFGSEVLQYEFVIFDRWGKTVFTTNSTEGSWDGTVGLTGVGAQDGVYNWQLKLRSIDEPVLRVMDGFVLLIR